MYDRRAIMTAAWFRFKHNRHFHGTFAEALHLEWINAKQAAARYDVWGDSFNGSLRKLASDVDGTEAARVAELWRTTFDYVETCAAGYNYPAHRRTAWVA